jgi:hypothetical protein
MANSSIHSSVGDPTSGRINAWGISMGLPSGLPGLLVTSGKILAQHFSQRQAIYS